MYTGTLAPVSNREDWTFTIELTDPSTGDAFDLTDATISLAIREHGCDTARITGSTDDGIITITSPATGGIFQIAIPVTTIKCLSPGSYDIGITVTSNDVTRQLIAGELPVIDGVMNR